MCSESTTDDAKGSSLEKIKRWEVLMIFDVCAGLLLQMDLFMKDSKGTVWGRQDVGTKPRPLVQYGTISFVPETRAILPCFMGTSHVTPKGVRYLRLQQASGIYVYIYIYILNLLKCFKCFNKPLDVNLSCMGSVCHAEVGLVSTWTSMTSVTTAMAISCY